MCHRAPAPLDGIQDRCRSILAHGEEADFLQSLDYYTTRAGRAPLTPIKKSSLCVRAARCLRVKYAFQMMNADTLRKRLREVHQGMPPRDHTCCWFPARSEELSTCLAGAPKEVEAAYTIPPDIAVAVEEIARDDPNALCVPLVEDFDLAPPLRPSSPAAAE